MREPLIDFNPLPAVSDKSKSQIKKETSASKEESTSSSSFQRQRVDMLLGELVKKFPIPIPGSTTIKKEEPEGEDSTGPDGDTIKQEKSDMRPPEKKMKFN